MELVALVGSCPERAAPAQELGDRHWRERALAGVQGTGAATSAMWHQRVQLSAA